MAAPAAEPIRTEAPGKPLGPIESIAVGSIARSPLNPRKRFDSESLHELAASIEQHGVQTPIHLRPADPLDYAISDDQIDGKRTWFLTDRRIVKCREHAINPENPDVRVFTNLKAAEDAVPQWEIVAGERRWRAARLAGLTHIPAIIRHEMTDQLHIELAIIENMQREDIDAIETARAYQQLRDLGNTVSQVAEKVGISVPAVSNATRLLDLPEAVLDLVSARSLEPTKARALLKFAGFPAVALGIARYVIRNRIPSTDLEKDENLWNLWYDIRNENLITPIGTAPWEKPCKECPFKANIVLGRSPYCFKPEHHAELEEADRKIQGEKIARETEAIRKRAEANKNLAAKLNKATDGAPSSPGVSLPEEAKPLVLSELKYGAYDQIFSDAKVEGCTADCPCRTMALDRNNKPVPICIDPGHRNALKGQATRLRRKRVKAEGEQRAADWRSNSAVPDTLKEALASPHFGTRARSLAVAAWTLLRAASVDSKRAVAKNLPEGKLPALLCQQGHNVADRAAWEILAAQPMHELITVLGEVYIREETAGCVVSSYEKTPIADYLLTEPKPRKHERFIDCVCGGTMKLDRMPDRITPIYRCPCGKTMLPEDQPAEEGTDPSDPTDPTEQPQPTSEKCAECGTELDLRKRRNLPILWCGKCRTWKFVETDTHDSAGIPKPVEVETEAAREFTKEEKPCPACGIPMCYEFDDDESVQEWVWVCADCEVTFPGEDSKRRALEIIDALVGEDSFA